jgi:hypothetical protein
MLSESFREAPWSPIANSRQKMNRAMRVLKAEKINRKPSANGTPLSQ